MIVYSAAAQKISGHVYLLHDGSIAEPTRIQAQVQNSEDITFVISDDNGFYSFVLKPETEYLITAEKDSLYDSFTIRLESHESLVQDIFLSDKHIRLGDITIRENPFYFGELTMTKQQFKVMPASFQDPARIVLRYPGISTPNDGANSIVFRGMSPETTGWQLFGADIVNPNHLANAETSHDRATGNAGGINALSGSVLDYYHFETNPADISYSNVISGVSSLKMSTDINSFIDISLLGVEAGYNKEYNGKNSYATFRYSFVDLLQKMGVDFGDEKIGYYDLSIYSDIFKTKHSELKVFGTFGESWNHFTAVDSPEEITQFKDVENIDYTCSLFIAGAKYNYYKGSNYYNSTITISGREDKRTEYTDERYQSIIDASFILFEKNTSSVISWHNQYRRVNQGYNYSLGLRTNAESRSKMFFLPQTSQWVSLYPYLKFENNPNAKFNYSLGSGVFYENYSNEITVEPSAGLKWDVSPKWTTRLNYRLSSHISDVNFFIPIQTPRFDLKRMKSHNFEAGLQYKRNTLSAGFTGFYHSLWDVMTFGDLGSNFNNYNGPDLNLSDQWLPELNVKGTTQARSYGTEWYARKIVFINASPLTLDVNFSIYDSKYRNDNKEYVNAKFDFSKIANISLSYEMDISKLSKNRKLIFSLANHYRGGQREPELLDPIYIDYRTIYDAFSNYTGRLGSYNRVDLRVVFSKQKHGSRLTHQWSFDIQNVLNHTNDGFRYYDFLLKELFIKDQLGIFPVISYRLEFGKQTTSM